MKPIHLIAVSIAAIIFSATATAEDLRLNVSPGQQERIKALQNTLEAEQNTAQLEADNMARIIESGRKALLEEIQRLETENTSLTRDVNKLSTRLKIAKQVSEKLEERKENIAADTKELTGHIRVSVKDVESLISQSMQTAFHPEKDAFLIPLLDQNVFPGYKQVESMADIVWEEILSSGEVRYEKATIIDPTGKQNKANVLTLGNFTAVYDMEGKTGFLVYSESSRKLIALPKPPEYFTRRKLDQYMRGESEEVPIDISRGAGVRQLSNDVNLLEQIGSGGPVVWPIVAIFVLGIILIIERFIFIFRKRINSNQLSNEITELLIRGDLEKCEQLCGTLSRKPVPSVILAGIRNKSLKREDLENVLQETILGQIPSLERFLSTIGMLATISPLLGLLGTVTGMINTFHVITFFGTGDARMMSGGISEALVTTMLGLAVAIPIMFGHTFISRAVETIIAQMEEKAVALTNTIEKIRLADDTTNLGNADIG